jgi:hypothetical protein
VDGLRFGSWQGQESFYFSKTSSLALGLTQPGYGGFFSHGMNQLGHKDHHSPPSNDEATSEQSYTS